MKKILTLALSNNHSLFYIIISDSYRVQNNQNVNLDGYNWNDNNFWGMAQYKTLFRKKYFFFPFLAYILRNISIVFSYMFLRFSDCVIVPSWPCVIFCFSFHFMRIISDWENTSSTNWQRKKEESKGVHRIISTTKWCVWLQCQQIVFLFVCMNTQCLLIINFILCV